LSYTRVAESPAIILPAGSIRRPSRRVLETHADDRRADFAWGRLD